MPDSPTRPVLDATWNWREPADPSAGQGPTNLRRAALVQTAVMVLVAAGLQFLLHHGLFARIVLAMAAVVLILGLIHPPSYRPVHAFGRWLGRTVGKALTYLLLVPFFFLFFTPVALFLRWRGRDPLHRSFRDARWTYWIARSPKEPSENIDKQFLREERKGRGELREVGDMRPREGGPGS